MNPATKFLSMLGFVILVTGFNMLWGYDSRKSLSEIESLRAQLAEAHRMAEADLLPPPDVQG